MFEERIDSRGEWQYILSENGAKISGYAKDVNDTLEIPSSVDGYPVVEIGEEAFFKCDGLTFVVIPQGVVSIGDRAFRECTALTGVTIPDSVTHLGEGAFARCNSLSAIEIPKGVTTMGMNPFYGCPLPLFSVSPDSESYVVVDGVLFDKQNERLISYPNARGKTEYSIPEGVQSIASGAFIMSNGLSNVEFPSSVNDIGAYAFEKCSNLSGVSIPESVTSIGIGTFQECTSLRSITLPDSVTGIGDGAFAWCDSLVSISIPDSVISIGDGAFMWCDSLTSISIPDGVTNIGNNTFNRCASLRNITIPNSVTQIGESAFYACYELSSAVLSSSLEIIDREAFAFCILLPSVIIPETVVEIGEMAFDSCPKLVLTVTGGSVAEQYASKNNIPFNFSSLTQTTREYDECTRSSPLNKGETVGFTITRDGNRFEIYLTLTDVLRGNAALQIIKEVRPYYEEPSNGKEYMVGEFFVSLACDNDSVSREFSNYDFDVVSASGRKYKTQSISSLDCSIDLFSGGSGTFYVPAEVTVDEEMYYLFLDTIWTSAK